jgi:hypothetical protein
MISQTATMITTARELTLTPSEVLKLSMSASGVADRLWTRTPAPGGRSALVDCSPDASQSLLDLLSDHSLCSYYLDRFDGFHK